ncbi:MAG TPA: SGNH/GDSL hydrolase family protein [Phototrophicaceae bacterium]|jgi:hypothetical protein|nr:SGNH/GDSL hydrolase family protein [Phototrophicaceae bacterium]
MLKSIHILRQIRWRQIVLALVGLAIAGFSLHVPDKWTGFQSGSVNQLLLLASGILLIVLGLTGSQFPIKELQKAYQTGAVILLNTILLLLIVELVVTLSINLKYQFVYNGQVIAEGWDVRPDFPYFQQVSWGKTYWKEHYQRHTDYRPYVMWRQVAQTGETINIDERGVRLTPGADCQPDAYTVWMFGGSTLWSEGAPDWMTIPAYVQVQLDEQLDRPVCVVNYGEIAYVSTQEVLTLTLLLQQGKQAPDLVIFYDGFNDVFASHQSGVAGTHQNLATIQRQLVQNSVGTAILNEIISSNTFQLLSGVVSGGGRADQYGKSDDLETLANDTVKVYLDNEALVAHLADAYGFDYAFFWQPTLFLTNKTLTSIESGILATQNQKWLDLNERVYNQIKTAAGTTGNEHLYYIADLFDDVDGFLWFDYVHIVPEGNALVAQKMVDTLRAAQSSDFPIR